MSSVLVTLDFPPAFTGGISRYYYDMCRTAAPDIHVIAPACKGAIEFDQQQSFTVTRVPASTSNSIMHRVLTAGILLIYTLRTLWAKRFVAIIAGHWFLCPVVKAASLLFGTRSVVILHGGELARYAEAPILRALFVRVFNSADKVIVNSIYTRKQFASEGVRPEKLRIVTPGVDVDRLLGAARGPEPTLNLWPLGASDCLVITVGTLVERKGHDLVISVLPSLLQKYPNLKYAIIGDGPNRENLEQLVKRNELSSAVHFAGRVADGEVRWWFGRCDIFVMPSRLVEGRVGQEGFGIVYLEANSFRKPVIGGDSGGVRDAIIDGVTGFLVNPESPSELETALDKLIRDPALRDGLGAQGQQRVKANFRWADRVRLIVDP